MPRRGSLSLAQARRVALAAQGLAAARPGGRVDRGHLRRVVGRLGLLQMDSVNVLARAQYMPLFSRLGSYDRTLLDRMAYRDHELFEYWGHEASLVDVRLQPLLRWRMAEGHRWNGPASVGRRLPELVAALEAEVLANGPLSARELDSAERRAEPWWGWSDTKRALEHLFWSGRLGALRRGNFERVYVDPRAVVPPDISRLPTPDDEVAKRQLLLVAAGGHGVGTARDLGDYWRMPIKQVRALLADLVAEGSLETVDVEGWAEPAYLLPGTVVPRTVDACALVSPFDPAMWERSRVERLHRFRYVIEIYVPERRRVHGYYVLPFLLGDTYVARVDLKADRPGRRLLVQAAHAEPDLADRGTDESEVAGRLADELRLLAAWLDLDDVSVAGRGDLAPALGRAVAVAPLPGA